MKPSFNPSVYFIADPSLCGDRNLQEVVALAVQGGATMVQLRDKAGAAAGITARGRALLDILRPHGVPLLINDHPDIAVEIGAQGIHIGQGDCTPEQARAIIGPDSILGLTAFTPAHFAALDSKIVDYVGTGPVFPTLTDKGKPVMGVDGFAALAKIAPVPIVAIGGITPARAADVFAAGANGVAMMRAISGAANPEGAARDFAGIVRTYKMQSAV